MQGPAAPAPDLDIATLLATFPPDVREEVLMTSDQAMLASLTPALLAEAQVKFALTLALPHQCPPSTWF